MAIGSGLISDVILIPVVCNRVAGVIAAGLSQPWIIRNNNRTGSNNLESILLIIVLVSKISDRVYYDLVKLMIERGFFNPIIKK